VTTSRWRCGALVVAALVLRANAAWAWGCEAHHVVAIMASALLEPKARAEAERLLERHPIDRRDRGCGRASRNPFADVSMWADAIRDDERRTSPWHFHDLPRDATRDEVRRLCHFGNCVGGALRREIATLASKSDEADRARALRFVIHFVADLHQPLHAITNGDRGGNCVPVATFGERVRMLDGGERYEPNLHWAWDTALVRALLASRDQTPGELAEDLRRRHRDVLDVARTADVDLDGWTWEAHEVADAAIYGGFTPPIPAEPRERTKTCRDNRDIGRRMQRRRLVIDDAYLERARPVLERQLARAGARLARVLNDVWR
jgi:hypothetical protein